MQDLEHTLGGQVSGNLGEMLSKFEQGQHDQVADSDVHDTYGQVATRLSQDEYLQAAQAAFERLTPEQREQFAQMLRSGLQQQGVDIPQAQQAPSDPGELAAATAQVHAQEPNLLQQMFAPGGVFSSPVAKAALLGITAMAAQRLMPARR
jgi:hypothetical protein